ncbi:MAG: TldD/PmbA family protein [Pseudobdellovibrio sp.]
MQTLSLSQELPNRFQSVFEQEFKRYKDRADFVAFKLISETTRDLTVRNGLPDAIQSFHDLGVLIEIVKNGHIGYGATCALTPLGIAEAFAKAELMTTESSKFPVAHFDLSVRPQSAGRYTSQRKSGLDSLSISEIYDFLKKTSLKLKISDKIIAASAEAMVIECHQKYFSSAGAHFEQDFNIVISAFSASAQDGQETQIRSLHGGRGICLQIGAEFFNLDSTLPQCEQTALEALELLTAENCPTTTCDLILAPDQMLLQIHESIGHPLELDRILGDERNFAGWSFVQPEDFGHLQYGSKIMNVTFDPTASNEMASYNFDEVGNPAKKVHLIKEGILQAGLGSLESQYRFQNQHGLKIPGVANSRSSSWNRGPIDRMANINLEGGTHTLEEMISSVENGVIMFANRSWSIDDYRRKFQFGCEYAKQIKNGKLTQTVKNPNYRGVTDPFWKNLKALSLPTSVETYGSPYCGKGEPSQVIRVGHSSPYALFNQIEIFGG